MKKRKKHKNKEDVNVRKLLSSHQSAECMDLLEEMELRERALTEENVALRRHHENSVAEITRLAAILAAREQVLELNRIKMENINNWKRKWCRMVMDYAVVFPVPFLYSVLRPEPL